MQELPKEEKQLCRLLALPIFQGVPRRDVQLAFRDPACRHCAFKAGETLPAGRRVGVVCTGELHAVRETAGGGAVLLNVLKAGTAFGLAAAFLPEEPPISRLRVQRATTVLFLEYPLLRRLLVTNARVAENYVAYLSGRVAFLTRRISVAAGGTAEQRLAAWLLSQQSDSHGNLWLPCSVSGLSSLLGVSRAALYRGLEFLRKDGILEQNGRCIQIYKPNRLRELAGFTEQNSPADASASDFISKPRGEESL